MENIDTAVVIYALHIGLPDLANENILWDILTLKIYICCLLKSQMILGLDVLSGNYTGFQKYLDV